MVNMVTRTKARKFEISKHKNFLEKSSNHQPLLISVEFVNLQFSSTTPRQFQTWLEVNISQLESVIAAIR